MKHKDDGKYVVVKGGQRISDLHTSEQDAIAEAERQRKLLEAQGNKGKKESQEVAIKQNLYG